MANTDLMLVKKKYTVEKFLQELKKRVYRRKFSVHQKKKSKN
ncbi:hypothetical protein [Candidatus Enterococcus mangumiae]|uniref:30S ribosomal protein S21 n=1 Tax=Candidatus Enterococcus mangumiae TaxID=2230878 RepID=A0ABZ2STP8_9ENTE|nr:hypothetical protein [Enterococcus sp. DIV1094]